MLRNLSVKGMGNCPAKAGEKSHLQIVCFQCGAGRLQAAWRVDSEKLADLSQGWWFSATCGLESCFTAAPDEDTLLSNLEQWILITNTWNVSASLALIVTASISSTFFRALFGEPSALARQAEVHLCSFRNSVWR